MICYFTIFRSSNIIFHYNKYMHKSVILFLSLLVILLPLGNSLNISNANANAVADYNNKVDKKQVSVSSLNCKNINVNVNGFELDALHLLQIIMD
jgi:hypothetical protein